MENWQEAVILVGSKMQDAMELLNQTEFRLVLVADKQNKLLGVISDGDVRRALLNGKNLTHSAENIMNKNPITAEMGATTEEINALIQKNVISSVPILDSKKIVGLSNLQDIRKPERSNNPVFIMAGGFGQRLGELTANKPKPLLPVGEKPILEHIVDRFIDAGFKRFYISTYYLSDQIVDFLGDGKSKGIEISYIEEEEPLGTGGALQLLPKNEINDTLIMMNSDILSTINFETFLRFHKDNKGIATMCVREYVHSIPYGVIKNENNSVTNIVEKPTHSYFINAGIYAIEPNFLDLLSEGNIDMPDLIQKMIDKKKKINAFPVHEYWLDIGTTNDYHKAQIDIKYL